jgi:amino acid transporter
MGINSRARALLYVLGTTQVSEGQEPNVVSASSKQQAAAASLPPSSPAGGQTGLKRTLTLTNAVLYGLGVTIGAGIYVLIGAAAARAGMHAPAAFVIAAVLMGLTAASFAELAGRMPVAAGEAAYVRAAFQSDRLATLVGLLAIAIAVVSAAAISVGSAGYVGVFLPLPEGVRITLVVLAMGAIAAWGIKESVVFAGVMTLIEVGGLLLLLIAAGVWSGPELVTRLPEAVPPIGNPAVAAGLAGATLLAVFAFLGFEGLVNIAEEVREPKRNLPRAIFITLLLTTVLYVLVAWVALVAVPAAELAASKAPLALVFERLTGAPPVTMSAIAVVATLNGIIVQVIMSSRVLYGLAAQGSLPGWLREVNPVTHTPINATLLTIAAVLVLALLLPLDELADITARITLLLFALINLALARIKMRETQAPANTYLAPPWMPWAGFATCIGLLVVDLALVVAARA